MGMRCGQGVRQEKRIAVLGRRQYKTVLLTKIKIRPNVSVRVAVRVRELVFGIEVVRELIQLVVTK